MTEARFDFVPEFSINSNSLQECDIPVPPLRADPFTLVIFGGAGDLSTRMLVPTLYALHREGELPAGCAVVGAGLPPFDDAGYRDLMEAACRAAPGAAFDPVSWGGFRESLGYVSGALEDPRTYDELLARLQASSAACGKNVVFYLAVPPDLTPVIVARLEAVRLCRGEYATKIVVEKPFGRDRASAAALNAALHRGFDEGAIYRIDHYLGKETVQNIAFLRFSNTIFERLWNSHYIDNVQVTVAEEIGVGHRAAFYERTGVVRDILQNHLLQLVSLVAMEPPIGFEPEYVRDEKVKAIRSIRPLDAAAVDRIVVGGQYTAGTVGGAAAAGYREERSVDPASAVPTFVAARLAVANWRWAGVPFYVRAGKRLARRVTEICIQYRQPPLRLFGRACDALEPDVLVLAIQPDEGLRLRFGVKQPGSLNRIAPVNVDFKYAEAFATPSREPYGRLLLDCMRGDLTLFERQDGVEAMWDVVDPITARWEQAPPRAPAGYPAGSWGPPDARLLLEREGRRWLTA